MYHAAHSLADVALAKPFMVPFSRDDDFTAREDILDDLDSDGQQVVPIRHKRNALIGLGGVG